MGGWRAGGKAERWSYHRGGTGEAQQAQLVGQPILEGEVPPYVCGGLGTGVPPMARGEGPPCGETTPPSKSSLCPRVAGSAYHWQGAWGGGCQSPRLPDWNWSCPPTCCVGGEAKELVVSTGGRAGVGLQDFSWDVRACVPCSSAPRPHLHTPPPRKATGSSGGPSKDSDAPPPAGRHLELRRFWRRVCSCSRRRLSSLTGLGMKPTSQPSFTSRPIHQSLLYFCEQETQRETAGGRHSHPPGRPPGGQPCQQMAPSDHPHAWLQSLMKAPQLPRQCQDPQLERREDRSGLPETHTTGHQQRA